MTDDARTSQRNRQRVLNKRMDDLFPQESPDQCRVCNEPVVDGRWNYCSERCRGIANAVQKMFLWDSVRDRILERDDHTCQECGLSKDMVTRAYWQTHEIAKERSDNVEEFWEIWRSYGIEKIHIFEVDHIQRIADGGHPFEESNLRTLCKECHGEKTAEENSAEDAAPKVDLTDYLE